MELTSRFHQTERDLLQMQGLLMAARSSTDDWHYIHIGDFTFHFFMVSSHLNPHEHICLWHDAEDKLVGYAMLGARAHPSTGRQHPSTNGAESRPRRWPGRKHSWANSGIETQNNGAGISVRAPTGQWETQGIPGSARVSIQW